MEKLPKYLPNIEKSDIPSTETLEQPQPEIRDTKSQTAWIIVLAFALLASLGVIVWFVFSGRIDQRIHGDNLHALLDQPTDESDKGKAKLGDIDAGVVVNDAEINLTDYDSNITITAAGEHTLRGISNYSVLVNADGAVALNLDGVTISSVETAAIANQSRQPLTINLLENTTNALTDGGASVYDGALFSNGALEINGVGKDATLGKLIISGRQKSGEGIATVDAPLTINSGKIMVTSDDDGINTGGDAAGTLTINGGILWVKAGGDGLDSNEQIVVNGGNILVIGSGDGKDGALDGDKGIIVNGGNLVALGTAALVVPDSASKQKALAMELSQPIHNGETVYIRNTATGNVVNFKTESDFTTLVYSSATLVAGDYEVTTGAGGQSYGTGVAK